MQLHGNEWNDIICNIVKFIASSEARGHDMMIRLHMIAMSWNVVASDGCILQQSFGYIPRFDILSIYKYFFNFI